MDSMRSLNTSLPGASSSKLPAQDSPEDLLQAFKVAALSVTKLYKTAASDQSRARAEGYQDALDDLLAFLDKENLGLSDGEGWLVRRWATERLDGRELNINTDSEDDADKHERAASPAVRRHSPTAPAPTRSEPAQPEPEPAAMNVVSTEPPSTSPASTTVTQPPTGNFTFRSPMFLSDLSLGDLNLTDSSRGQDASSVPPVATNTPPITVTRPSRSTLRQNHAARHNARSSTSLRSAAGQKRKINIGDFFDISNIGPGKDGFGGGGKRGKFT